MDRVGFEPTTSALYKGNSTYYYLEEIALEEELYRSNSTPSTFANLVFCCIVSCPKFIIALTTSAIVIGSDTRLEPS
jgi:hypothetical protein